jgi:hypothetical protein
MSEPIVVPNLVVEVVTGDSLMDHGGGFLGIFARVVLDEPATMELLETRRQAGEVVALRCARLEVVGRITRRASENGKTTFVLSIEDLKFRDVEPRPIVRRIRGS